MQKHAYHHIENGSSNIVNTVFTMLLILNLFNKECTVNEKHFTASYICLHKDLTLVAVVSGEARLTVTHNTTGYTDARPTIVTC